VEVSRDSPPHQARVRRWISSRLSWV